MAAHKLSSGYPFASFPQPSSVNAEKKNSINAPATLLVVKESAPLDLVEKASFIAVCETLSSVSEVEFSMKLAPQIASICKAACCWAWGNWVTKLSWLARRKAALVQPVHAKFFAPTRIFWKSPKAVATLRLLKDSVPTISCRLLNVSVTQSWLVESSFKHMIDRAVGYTSWTIWVTVSDTPLAISKSLWHPVVMLDTTVARVSLLQNPVEQRPVSQLLIVSGTDWPVPTKKVSRAAELRHAASGDVRIPFREFVQSLDND